MFIDLKRVDIYLMEILRNYEDLTELLNKYSKGEILADKWKKKGLRHTLLEIAESMANVLQHLLAKGEGYAVEGYTGTIIKAGELKILDKELSSRLKLFFDFRNSLIYRYWVIDDDTIYENVKENNKDFLQFIEQIRNYIQRKKESQI